MTPKELEGLAIEKRREYFKQWRAKNPDKTRKHRESYWKRKALKELSEREAQS